MFLRFMKINTSFKQVLMIKLTFITGVVGDIEDLELEPIMRKVVDYSKVKNTEETGLSDENQHII